MTQFIVYTTQCGLKMRAAVRRRHRDGSLTVEPFFYIDRKGNDEGLFQGGHTVRVPREHYAERLL